MTEPHTDHAGLEILGVERCHQLLQSQNVGRVAFLEAGEPVVLPVVYRFHDSRIVFRSAIGAKLDVAAMQRPVAFEIDGWDESARSGWSVLVRGVPREVRRAERIAELDSLGVEQWVHGPRPMRWIEIIPDDISGRSLRR